MTEKIGNFDLINRTKLGFTDVVVTKWKSRVTGLGVVHLDYEAPIVDGYFVVPTEIFDDSGCPHTLEHLVFMGSEKYPYKGIIDHFANRGFSNGTNAWTDTDHTAYTVSTAGEQGFLQLLPIYVDHILYPTMTKAGFVTEVHHIDPKGHDSGVVYSEMQGRENTSGDRMSLVMQRILDPPGSAYRSETGGLMAAIRVLTVEQIRSYHRSYYVPHNLTLIVAGKLSSGTSSLISVVQDKIEPTLISHGQNHGPRPPAWKRPFLETPSSNRPLISSTIVETVEFPEKDESMGEIIMTFIGPAPGQFLERKALDILGTYLTSSSVAPLNKEYVEIENPMCSYIYFTEDTRATKVYLPIYIGSVPTEHLDTFHTRLASSLKQIAKDGIDMARMTMVINRDIRQLRSKLESSKGEAFSGTIITDILYGAEDGSELKEAMDEMGQYDQLRKWSSQDWVDLLQKYYADAEAAIVLGKPSAKLADKIEKDEDARIADQVKRLGPEGLKKAESELNEAKEEHDRPIPPDVLKQFHIPDTKSISWIPVSSFQDHKQQNRTPTAIGSDLARHVQGDGVPPPFFVQYDHVESDFVSIHAYFSLAKIPDRLRSYINVYISAFFSLPVKLHSGEVLGHEEVVNRLDDETVSYDIGLGVNSLFSETLRVTFKVELAAYETAIAWLHDLVYGAQFTKERLQITLAKIQQSLPEMKRDGNTVLGSLWANSVYDTNSTSRATAVLPQADFIPQLVKELQENPEKVVADFEEIRSYVTDPSGIRISITGNVLKTQRPRSTWNKFFNHVTETPLSPVPLSIATLSALGKNPAKKAVVLSLPTIESSFTTHTTKGPTGFAHPEYPAIRVTLEVLNATESYLWRYIRGSGLAYGAYVALDLEAGLLSFTLYRSSNCIEAYKQARTVVNGLVDGTVALDDTTIEAAKSGIVYGIARAVSSPGRAATTSFINQALKSVPQNYQIELLEKFQQVTKEDIIATLKSHFLPMFDSSTSICTIVTAPGKADDITTALNAEGFEVERRSLELDPDEMMDEDGSSDDEGSGSERGSS